MPPATEPVREQVKQAILARLQTIAEGPDYWYTPSLVTRVLLSLDQYTARLQTGPVLGLQRSSGSTIRFDETTWPRVDSHVLIVDINAYVHGDIVGGTPADTRIERVWEDIRRCLQADLKLGGLATDLRPDGEMETDRGSWEPDGWMRQPWRVELDEVKA